MKAYCKLALVLGFVAVSLTSNSSFAQLSEDPNVPNILDELDPFDPNIDAIMEELDRNYEEETGLPSHIDQLNLWDAQLAPACYRASCPVWISIDKSEQQGYLYVNGTLERSFLVSTGTAGHGTPNFDQNPNGRVYDRYTSSKYPGGDYKGLGNMPYAVFIKGGFAIHGTPESNWPKLGRRASHGCIRVHPDNGYRFNRLVREHGIRNVWITVQD